MRSNLFIAMSLAFLTFFLVYGCAKPPTKEINAAEQAIKSAQEAEADKYAPEKFKAAKDSLDKARAKVDAGDYSAAKNLALEAEEKATAAAKAAKENKAKAKREAKDLIAKAKSAFSEAEKLMGKAPKRGKGVEEDIKQLRTELSEAQSTSAEAQAAFENGDYLIAKDKAEKSIEKANMVRKDLKLAIEKAEEYTPWYMRGE